MKTRPPKRAKGALRIHPADRPKGKAFASESAPSTLRGHGSRYRCPLTGHEYVVIAPDNIALAEVLTARGIRFNPDCGANVTVTPDT